MCVKSVIRSRAGRAGIRTLVWDLRRNEVLHVRKGVDEPELYGTGKKD